jgi:hypothetical protein
MPAVPAVRHPDGMRPAPHADDAGAWDGQAADVPAEWFAQLSWLHGMRHTQRVHIHAQRLVRELHCPEADAQLALFAIRYHCRGDGHSSLRAAGQDDAGRALRILWLLKDADALDRVRLGGGAYEVDSTALRHECTLAMVGFAEALLSVMP